MKCIVIDDEPLAVEILNGFCGRTPQLELVGSFTDAVLAHSYLMDHPVELIFLDINMPDLSGIQLVKALDKKPLIIFTTAYPQHAVTGFELDAVDYLLKPIAFDRFLKAVQKAKQRKAPQAPPAATPAVSTPPVSAPQAAEEPYLFIKSGYRHLKVKVDDVLYIQSEKNYVSLVTPHNRVMSLLSMDQALAMLPKGGFVRIHKSYIVALKHIQELDKHSVKLKQIELPIGDAFRKGLFQAIAGDKA